MTARACSITTPLATYFFTPYLLVSFRQAILLTMLLFSVASILHTTSASAFEVHVVDQEGNPVKDAVLAVPKGSIKANNPTPAVMDQIDVAFVPHVLAIEQGQQVIFPNSDNIRHHVYSFSNPKRFEIKLYKGVPKTPIRFEEGGLVALGCNIHDSMLGYIYVSPWPNFMVTDTTGVGQFEGTPDKIAVWHPWIKDLNEPLILELATEGSQDKDALTDTYRITINLTKPRPQKRFKKFKKRYND